MANIGTSSVFMDLFVRPVVSGISTLFQNPLTLGSLQTLLFLNILGVVSASPWTHISFISNWWVLNPATLVLASLLYLDCLRAELPHPTWRAGASSSPCFWTRQVIGSGKGMELLCNLSVCLEVSTFSLLLMNDTCRAAAQDL